MKDHKDIVILILRKKLNTLSNLEYTDTFNHRIVIPFSNDKDKCNFYYVSEIEIYCILNSIPYELKTAGIAKVYY